MSLTRQYLSGIKATVLFIVGGDDDPVSCSCICTAHSGRLQELYRGYGYVIVTKEFIEKKPHTALVLTKKGRDAFQQYRRNIRKIAERLPEQNKPPSNQQNDKHYMLGKPLLPKRTLG